MMALLLAAGIGAPFVYHALTRPAVDSASTRVEVEGCDEACAAALRLALGERLERFGLRISEAPSAVETRLVLQLEQVTEGIREGTLHVRASAVMSRAGEPLLPPLMFDAEAVDERAAMLEIGMRALDAGSDRLAAAMLSSPQLDAQDPSFTLERADALALALRALPAHQNASAQLVQRCGQPLDTEENVSCVTRCGAENHALALGGDSWVQTRQAAWALPLESPHDVQRVPLASQLTSAAGTTHWLPSRVDEVHGHAGVFAYIAHLAHDSALILGGDSVAVLARATGSAVLLAPAPSPDGREVAYVAAEHRRGVPHLMVVSANGGTPRDLAPYVEDFRWVQLDRPLLLARVSGAERTVSPLPPRAHEEGEGYEDEQDDYALVEVGDPDAPPGSYAALLDPASGEVMIRVGGRERIIIDIIGAGDHRLWMTYRIPPALRGADAPVAPATPTCGVLTYDMATAEEVAVPTAHCLDQPRLLQDGRVAATAIVSGPEDPSPSDRELVLVDAEGGLSILTQNATDDFNPESIGSDHLGFTRLLPRRYGRFPRSAACSLALPDRAPDAPL